MALYMLREIISGSVIGASQREELRGNCSAGARLSMVLMTCGVFAGFFCWSVSSAAASVLSSNSLFSSGRSAEPVAQAPNSHGEVLAAGFGFQAGGSSMMTVRTYDARTGAILSEDSFDVTVKEEGISEQDENNGRIFAGGIGIDLKENSKFMLRVYDAESGRFLWEGQLNLLKVGEGGVTKANATIIPSRPFRVPTAAPLQKSLQTLFSVRAVNPVTGGVIWQDQFAPGIRKRPRTEGVSFVGPLLRPADDPIGHIFDLVVRTYDRGSGKLLWEDSFEQLDRIEEPAIDSENGTFPQAIPFWVPVGEELAEVYHTALH